jgi:hypothetical protein
MRSDDHPYLNARAKGSGKANEKSKKNGVEKV